ncbi:hypothetical protein QBC37DRAFT_165528 [Rhypophila decipiens]|uniref:Uncharacterized protein n=1 Tax=Rhypophila decipiens TaxID=261697 RepID=A0AAN6YI90_9PEZI|nr:hypothetical protein QBC37DRAFT_165528 [Rhypophila decipiens]
MYMHSCNLLAQAMEDMELWRSDNSLPYSTSNKMKGNMLCTLQYSSQDTPPPPRHAPPIATPPLPTLPTKGLPSCPRALGVWNGGCGVKVAGGTPGKGWALVEGWTWTWTSKPCCKSLVDVSAGHNSVEACWLNGREDKSLQFVHCQVYSYGSVVLQLVENTASLDSLGQVKHSCAVMSTSAVCRYRYRYGMYTSGKSEPPKRQHDRQNFQQPQSSNPRRGPKRVIPFSLPMSQRHPSRWPGPLLFRHQRQTGKSWQASSTTCRAPQGPPRQGNPMFLSGILTRPVRRDVLGFEGLVWQGPKASSKPAAASLQPRSQGKQAIRHSLG